MCTTVNLNMLFLNVRGIREQTKRRSIFSYLKDRKQTFIFYKKHILNLPMKFYGKMNGVASHSFPMALTIVKVYAF